MSLIPDDATHRFQGRWYYRHEPTGGWAFYTLGGWLKAAEASWDLLNRQAAPITAEMRERWEQI
jgi:hypothetical protein